MTFINLLECQRHQANSVCYVAFWDEITLAVQESEGHKIDEKWVSREMESCGRKGICLLWTKGLTGKSQSLPKRSRISCTLLHRKRRHHVHENVPSLTEMRELLSQTCQTVIRFSDRNITTTASLGKALLLVKRRQSGEEEH
ncbi:PREDICTED: uncharacterized protein LOC104806951 [Tarenaya hassleriana]|uniref:uncharacterized protein LOC104806951 n=1 Tax=Tarenaya hassleriana TaxID=28532 RepID=UPI00053C26F0|nr:PREDICTED: uncharacterized protein LOC104806951 [Tarenaya hassleriana]